MKKIILEQDLEKVLHAIYESAIRYMGMSLFFPIQKILNSVKLEDDIKYLELGPEEEQILHMIFDAALKNSGMQVHFLVHKVIQLIND